MPAITHVDYSARVQTVDRERHARYHEIIRKFSRADGLPRHREHELQRSREPIVCSPEDAYRCFMSTNMDVLVLDNHVLYKHEQPEAQQHEVDEYLAQFSLD